MFKRNNNNNQQEEQNEKTKKQYEYVEKTFSAEYMGGHMLYPNKTDADVEIFEKHIDIRFGRIHKHVISIPTVAITNITSEDEKRITKTRVLMTGIIPGLLWKKKFRYTVIEYEETPGLKQSVVVDFHREAEAAQQMIYTRMIKSRTGLD